MSKPTSNPAKARKRRDNKVWAALNNPAWNNNRVSSVLGWGGNATRSARRELMRITPPTGTINIKCASYL